jgi:hypothetical protein
VNGKLAITMPSSVFFITHPEVSVEPARKVADWSLSPLGEKRMRAFVELPVCARIVAVYSSAERHPLRAELHSSAYMLARRPAPPRASAPRRSPAAVRDNAASGV